MSQFRDYANKATAVRGLGRFLGVNSRNNPDLDVASLIETRDGRYGFDEDKALAAVGLGGLDETDQEMKTNYGHVNCPECGVHLTNGVEEYDALADEKGEKAAYSQMQHEFACMGCGHQFGKAIDKPKARARGTTGRRYENRATSDVEKPSEIVWAIADADPKAARKDIVAAAVAKGVTVNTANAAYQHWRKARGLTKPRG